MGMLILLGWAYLAIVLIAAAVLGHRMHHPAKRGDGYALARNLPLEPAELHLEFDEETFTFPDKTQSLLWTITGQQPRNPVLIITHGWNESRFDVLGRLAFLWPMLIHRCSAIVVYDARAHGSSTASLSTLGAREQADLIHLTQEMQARHPGRRIVLYGFSMGGGISLGAAAQMGPRHGDASSGVAGVIADGMNRFVDEGVRQYFRSRRWPTVPVVDLGLVVPALLLGSHDDRADDARRYGGPLLLLHGDLDPVCPLHAIEQVALANPQARLTTFPNGGHLDLALNEPELYRQAIESLLIAVESPDHSSSPAQQKDSPDA